MVFPKFWGLGDPDQGLIKVPWSLFLVRASFQACRQMQHSHRVVTLWGEKKGQENREGRERARKSVSSGVFILLFKKIIKPVGVTLVDATTQVSSVQLCDTSPALPTQSRVSYPPPPFNPS